MKKMKSSCSEQSWVWEQEGLGTPGLYRGRNMRSLWSSLNAMDVVSYPGLSTLQIKTLSSRGRGLAFSHRAGRGRAGTDSGIWFLRKNVLCIHNDCSCVDNVCAQTECGWEKHCWTGAHKIWGGGVVGPERGQVCSLKRQLLGLPLEDEGGQVGTQNKRSTRVLRRKTLRQVFGKGWQ